VKIASVGGELLLEAHPPVDAEGQSYEPDVDAFAQRLDAVLGETTAAIHWDLALETLRTARGIPAVVGMAATPDAKPEPVAELGPPAG
jgi:hypothetical protein